MKVALNPLQWLATHDGWLDFGGALPLPKLISEVHRLGFSAVHADPPAGMSARDYGRALADGGLSPAPGYLSASMEEPTSRDEIVARAASQSEQHAELGLTEMFVACRMLPTSPRVSRPAIGFDPDTPRLGEIATTLARVGEATRKHGVTSCLGVPSIGSGRQAQAWIATRLALLAAALLVGDLRA